jgi:hypothetical protein
MNKLLTSASLAAACFVALASPAFAQGMAGPAASDGMAGPMTNDTMKMDHKKPAKKTAMKHDGMGMAAPSGGMASGGMAGDKMAAPQGGMASGSMAGPGH